MDDHVAVDDETVKKLGIDAEDIKRRIKAASDAFVGLSAEQTVPLLVAVVWGVFIRIESGTMRKLMFVAFLASLRDLTRRIVER